MYSHCKTIVNVAYEEIDACRHIVGWTTSAVLVVSTQEYQDHDKIEPGGKSISSGAALDDGVVSVGMHRNFSTRFVYSGMSDTPEPIPTSRSGRQRIRT